MQHLAYLKCLSSPSQPLAENDYQAITGSYDIMIDLVSIVFNQQIPTDKRSKDLKLENMYKLQPIPRLTQIDLVY